MIQLNILKILHHIRKWMVFVVSSAKSFWRAVYFPATIYMQVWSRSSAKYPLTLRRVSIKLRAHCDVTAVTCKYQRGCMTSTHTVYPKKYVHGFVVLCFVVVMQSFIMNSHEVFIHIHQGCFAGTGAIVRLPQCQWSKPDGYGKISQCITTTKHSKAKTVCIFLGICCRCINHLGHHGFR